MITNQLSRNVGLGICIAAGTFGCAAQGGVTAANNGGSTVATGGGTSANTSASSNVGGGTNGSQGGTTGVSGSGGTAGNTNTGGTSSNASAGGRTATGGSAPTGGSASTGGSVSTGGKNGTGGTSNTGGSKTGTSTGGKSTTGGTPATGGSKATGGSQATGGATQSSSCSITVKNASYSEKIGTVGIVTWSTTLANVTEAQIDFGVDTSYGLTAPVDIKATDYRTLLLGMKQAHAPYHYRITAKSGSSTCTGTDSVFSANTAAASNNVKKPTVTTNNKAAAFGGFLVTEGYRLNTNSGGDYAFILDGDGDIVWWYQPSGFTTLSVAKMTYDGKSMWIANDNVPQATTHVGRVTMDGTFEDFSTQFKDFNHDLTVLPDETVIFIAYDTAGNCDDVRERKTDGSVRTIVNACKAFGNAASSHCNAIQYDKSDDTVVVSDDTHSGYFKTDRQGNIKWVLNGGSSYNSFDKSGGGGTGWTGNHNLHVLGPDHILFFNNGVSAGAGGVPTGNGKAVARELTLNLTAMTTTETWKYESGLANAVMGDVQRLDNGNTIVAYSTAGTVQEVDASKNVLQQLVWSGVANGGIGYITKRRTLYGAPPR